MGDIALPNIDYDTQWQSQKLNKSFQQELERMKQEVYHEGLQVEEEGLTDIVRKKTKLPNVHYADEYAGGNAAADRNERQQRHDNEVGTGTNGMRIWGVFMRVSDTICTRIKAMTRENWPPKLGEAPINGLVFEKFTIQFNIIMFKILQIRTGDWPMKIIVIL